MNPWAILMIGLGLILIVIGVKGSQHEVIAAFTGKNAATSTNTASTTQAQGNTTDNTSSNAGTSAGGGRYYTNT